MHKNRTVTNSRSIIMEDEELNERQPLLPGKTNGAKRTIPVVRSRATASVLLLLTVLLISFADQIQESPRTRILESIICYGFYEKFDPTKINLGRDRVGPGAIGGVDEMYCKADAVANELAMLDGYLSMFSFLPGLILAVPFGWLADKYGRWKLVFINLVQYLLTTCWIQIITWFWQVFDLRMIWYSAAFSALGGGSAVIASLFFVAVADITPEADRAGGFLRLGAVNVCANLFMPPLAAALMSINPWIPSFVGTGLFVIAIIVWLPMPETMNYPSASSSSAIDDDERDSVMTAHLAPPDLSAASNEARPAAFTHRLVLQLQESTKFLLDDWRIPALISTFTIHQLVATSGPLLLQYLSKRYALRMSEATLLMTIRQGVNTLLLFLVLPALSSLLVRRWRFDGRRKDLLLARLSQAAYAVGWALLAASPRWPAAAVSLVVASCGQGAAILTRSFLTGLLPPAQVARVYSLISVLDNLGAMAGAPLMAALFTRGVHLGGAGIGLPFYFVALVSALFAALLYAVRLREHEAEETQSGNTQ